MNVLPYIAVLGLIGCATPPRQTTQEEMSPHYAGCAYTADIAIGPPQQRGFDPVRAMARFEYRDDLIRQCINLK